MSDFDPLKTVSASISVIRYIFSNVLVITNGNNQQISERFVRNVKTFIFWQGEGVVRNVWCINEWSLNFQMDGDMTKFCFI